MHIREAELSDWEGILPLLRGFGRLEEDGAEGRFQRILSHPDFVLVVAEVGETLVGYALAQAYGPRLRSGEESVRLHDLLNIPFSRLTLLNRHKQTPLECRAKKG